MAGFFVNRQRQFMKGGLLWQSTIGCNGMFIWQNFSLPPLITLIETHNPSIQLSYAQAGAEQTKKAGLLHNTTLEGADLTFIGVTA